MSLVVWCRVIEGKANNNGGAPLGPCPHPHTPPPAGGEHLSALGRLLGLCGHRRDPAGCQVRPARREHPRGLAAAHRRQGGPLRLCGVSAHGLPGLWPAGALAVKAATVKEPWASRLNVAEGAALRGALWEQCPAGRAAGLVLATRSPLLPEASSHITHTWVWPLCSSAGPQATCVTWE